MSDELYLEGISKSRENERALIGSVLRDGSIYERAREIVSSQDFGWTSYGKCWEAFESLFLAQLSIDTITVGDELERHDALSDFQIDAREGEVIFSKRAALSKLRETGDPKNFLSYAEIVQDYSVKRKFLALFNKGAAWAINGRRAKDIAVDILQEFSTITIYGRQDEYTVPISVGVSEAYDWTGRAANGEIVGVPTGFIDLDHLLGSLVSGNVYILAGRPKMGKTGFLLTVARHVAKEQNKQVGIFSLEMSRLQVAQRLISQESKIDLQRIIHGELLENEWPIFTHAVETVGAYPISINDLSSININQIRQTARKIKAAGGLDLLIVDYLQLASGEGVRYERRDLEVSAVSRGLKYLARELEVPILCAAQLSRAVEQRTDKRPILSDLRESGSIEQDAYAVMFIHRPDQYEKDSDKQNVTEVIVAAHRNGPTGSIELTFRGALAKFENAATKSFRPNDTAWQDRADMGD